MLEIRVTYKLPEGGGLGGGLGGFGGGGGAGILLGIAVLVVVAAAAESAASSKSKGTRMVIDGCRDCGTFWFDASEMKIVKQSTSIEGEDVEIARMEAESGEKNIGSYAIANCLHIDDLTDKKCRRVTFRGTGYCYRHQPE